MFIIVQFMKVNTVSRHTLEIATKLPDYAVIADPFEAVKVASNLCGVYSNIQLMFD